MPSPNHDLEVEWEAQTDLDDCRDKDCDMKTEQDPAGIPERTLNLFHAYIIK